MFIKRQNKYGNTKTLVNGIAFDSKKEARVIGELQLREKAHDISDLRMQVTFELQSHFADRNNKLIRAITYIADATYLDNQMQMHVVDAKGMRTEVYKLKKKLFLYKYPEMIFEEI